MKINLNSFVTVTLTEVGIDKFIEWQQRTCDIMPNDLKIDFIQNAAKMVVGPGKVRCQITELNKIFGDWCEVGRECFSMNVEI